MPFYLSKKIQNCLLSLVEMLLPSCYNDVKKIAILLEMEHLQVVQKYMTVIMIKRRSKNIAR